MNNIKIYCRSFDLRLYRLSKGLYEQMGFPCVRLTDQTADGYFYAMLQDEDCDIAINVDEDCFIANPDAVLRLAEYVSKEGVAIAGCQDGGIAARCANPLVLNPFFNVVNLKLIREHYSLAQIRQAVRDFRYEDVCEDMIAAAPEIHLAYRYNFHISTHTDPYYPFMLWLVRNFKVLYLPNATHADGITTQLYWQNDLICLHTWMARYYAVPSFIVRHWQPTAGRQQHRIDAVIDETYGMRGIKRPAFGLKDEWAFIGNKIVRWAIKIPQRIAGWPKKLKRKWSAKSNEKAIKQVK